MYTHKTVTLAYRTHTNTHTVALFKSCLNDKVRQGQTIIPGGNTCFQRRNYVPTLMKFDVVVRTASVTFD